MKEEKPKVNFDLPALEIIDQQSVRWSFIDTLIRMHGFREEDAESMYERESRYYKRAVQQSKTIAECTGLSLVSTFLEAAVNCLSLQPGQKSEAYIEARSSKIIREITEEKNGREVKIKKEVWVKLAGFVITVYGELNLRIRAGQIIRANNPVVVYEGDHFQPRTNERGELTVEYIPAVPRKSKKIIGCWVSLILPHNGIDFKWLLEDDIERLKNYSIPKSTSYNPKPSPNALYVKNDGQIDPGFLEAKTLKHAFRAYTKLKLSQNVKLDGETDNEEVAPFGPAQEEVPTVSIEPQNDDDDIF